MVTEKIEDKKGVIRLSGKSKKDRQYNGQKKKGQKYKQWCTKHYTENKKLSNPNPTKTRFEPAPLVTPVVLHLLQTRW